MNGKTEIEKRKARTKMEKGKAKKNVKAEKEMDRRRGEAGRE